MTPSSSHHVDWDCDADLIKTISEARWGTRTAVDAKRQHDKSWRFRQADQRGVGTHLYLFLLISWFVYFSFFLSCFLVFVLLFVLASFVVVFFFFLLIIFLFFLVFFSLVFGFSFVFFFFFCSYCLRERVDPSGQLVESGHDWRCSSHPRPVAFPNAASVWVLIKSAIGNPVMGGNCWRVFEPFLISSTRNPPSPSSSPVRQTIGVAWRRCIAV